MGTPTRYAQRVAKAKYTPPNKEVAARIEATVAHYRRIAEVEAQYKKALAEIVDQDAVPIAHIADELGLTRKTVYRHLGRSMT